MGRTNYLLAKEEEKNVDLYAMDLVWSIAKRYYNGLPMPSEIWSNRNKIDRRSAKQIVSDTIKGLGGE